MSEGDVLTSTGTHGAIELISSSIAWLFRVLVPLFLLYRLIRSRNLGFLWLTLAVTVWPLVFFCSENYLGHRMFAAHMLDIKMNFDFSGMQAHPYLTAIARSFDSLRTIAIHVSIFLAALSLQNGKNVNAASTV